MNSENILVTGGDGLIGSALKKIMPNADYISIKDYDLTSEGDVKRLFLKTSPTRVIHLAARVGGIVDNVFHPVEYFDDNVIMNTLLIKYAFRNNVRRFTGMLSSCIYPDTNTGFLIKEEDLHNGAPTKTNFSYGIAKRTMAVQIDAYNTQHKTKYNYLIPCNMYGYNDKDNNIKSHFIAALIKKIYLANKNGDKDIVVYGSGKPLRQYMHADDMAKIIKLMVDNDIIECFNVASNKSLSINDIVKTALRVTNSCHLNINYDYSKPDGQFKKDVDTSKFKSLFPDFKFINIEEGIKLVYNDYKTKHDAKI